MDLYKDFDVAILGINNFGLQRYDTSKYFIYSVDRTDMLGLERMNIVLKEFNPDIILLFQDVFNIDFVLPIIKKWNSKIPVITYFPIDGRPVNRAWEQAFKTPDKLITYTKWGVEGILETFPNLGKPIEYLYHGVDTTVFNVLPAGARQKLKEERGWDNRFVLVSVNRFQPRKMLMLAFRAHALFTKGYKVCKCGNVYLSSKRRCDMNNCGPEDILETHEGRNDALLYIHANTEERMMGPGRANLLQSHLMNAGFVDADVNKSVGVFGGNIYNQPYSDPEMNILYNISDVNVSTTLGEGVGLSLIEAAATGTVSIAPNHSSIPEMLGDTGHIIPNQAMINIALDNGHIRPVISIKHYIEAVEIEYQKWIANGRKKIISQAAIDRVHTLFRWEDKCELMRGWLKDYV
jgi:glycosyltransferase involved in cell wall biosynthesis